MRSYAIGDIHGQLHLLKEAHRLIEIDRAATGDANAPVIHVGDLVDRGPDSPGVIDTLLNGQLAGKPWIVLKGNHDRMFSYFLDGHRDPALRAEFEYLHPRIGGLETLAAYGLDASTLSLEEAGRAAANLVPHAHRAFLADLPSYHLREKTLFVHAGIAPLVPLEDQTETDMAWIRAPFLEHTQPHPWLVVHGHSHIEAPTHYGNRVNIDSGAAYGGPLTTIVIEGNQIFTLSKIGRTPLRPN